MMKFLVGLLIAISALGLAMSGSVSASPTLRQAGVMTVCSYTQFAPISYGHGEGYEADLLRAIADEWRVGIEFNPIEQFDGIWLTPSRLGCDIAIGGITPTQERKDQGAVFSPTTASFAQSLLVRRADYDSGRIISYKSFLDTKMIIGVVPGTTGESFAWQRAEEAGLPRSVFKQYFGEDELLAALKRGEIDAIARGEVGNRYQQGLDAELLTIDLRDFGEGFAMSLDPANTDFQKQFAEALASVTKSGTIGFVQWTANHGVFNQ
jgi:ABC-type amino acid transport substrate-binding protein